MATPPSVLVGSDVHAAAQTRSSADHYVYAQGVWHPITPPLEIPHGPAPASGGLGPERIAELRDNGFTVLRQFYHADHIANLRSHMRGVLHSFGPRVKAGGEDAHVHGDDTTAAGIRSEQDLDLNPYRVGYINDLHLQDEALAAHLVHPKLMRGLTEVLGPDIDCWQCATVIKPPGQSAAGGGYGWVSFRHCILHITGIFY